MCLRQTYGRPSLGAILRSTVRTTGEACMGTAAFAVVVMETVYSCIIAGILGDGSSSNSNSSRAYQQ